MPDESRTGPLTFDIVRNPVEELEEAYKENDYIKVITYGCAVIEYYGKRLLIREFKNKLRPYSLLDFSLFLLYVIS